MPNPWARRAGLSSLTGGLHDFIDERIDAKQRERKAAYTGPGGNVLGGGVSVGGGGTGTDPVIEDAVSVRVAKATVADNATATVDLGAAAGCALFQCSPVWVRRNSTTAALAAFRFTVLHDGTDAWIVDLARAFPPGGTPALLGVTLAVAIVGGIVQLTLTASDLTPDATADVILVITTVEALL